MAIAAKPEILSPRTTFRERGARNVFDDEHLDMLSHLLDDFLRVPGTPIRFGLDGIVGFIPGVGDILGGLASSIIIVAAWVRGVPPDHDRAHGDERGDRDCCGIRAGGRQSVRYCVAGQSPQLQAARRLDCKSARALGAQAGCSSASWVWCCWAWRFCAVLVLGWVLLHLRAMITGSP